MWHAKISDQMMGRTAHLTLANELSGNTNILVAGKSAWYSVQHGTAFPADEGLDFPLDALDALYTELGRFLRKEQTNIHLREQVEMLQNLLAMEQRRVGDLHGVIVRALHNMHPEPLPLPTATLQEP